VTITETTINTADCATLESDLNSLIEQATTCNSCMNTDSCINGPKIHDTCGCLVGASSMATDIANNAESLYHTWVTQGCGPYQCEQPCFSDNTPYYCTPQGPNCGGSCQPGFGTGG